MKGSGATSGTLALLVENSSNLDSLQVFDSQEVVVGHIGGSTPSSFFGLATQFGVQNTLGTGTNAFIVNNTAFNRIVSVGDNGSFLSRTFDTVGAAHFSLNVADNSSSFATFSNKQIVLGSNVIAGTTMVQINNQDDNSVSPAVPFTNILDVVNTSGFVTMQCLDDGNFTVRDASGVNTFVVSSAGDIGIPGQLEVGGSAPNTTLDVNGDFATRVNSPASFAVDQDDFDNGAFSFLRLTNTSAVSPDSVDVTGFSDSADGKRVVVVNVSSTQDIIFKHEDAGSTAANRFNNGNAAADKTLSPNDTVEYIYDTTTNRWRYIGGSV